MAKKNSPAPSFEQSLTELENIVSRLETGGLTLEEALNEFERGIQLAREGQTQLRQAEQKVQILLNESTDTDLAPFDNSDKESI